MRSNLVHRRALVAAATCIGVFFFSGILGCSASVPSSPQGPNVLTDGVEAKTLDARAVEECNAYILAESPMVAAMDATAGEVRELKTVVKVSPTFGSHLPDADSAYIAICIYRVDAVSGEKYYEFAAQWAGVNGNSAGNNELITFW